MTTPGSLLVSPNDLMLSFVLTYEKSLTDLSIDVSLVRLESELWVGHVMAPARVICDGRD